MDPYTELLYQALGAEVGIVIKTHNPQSTISRLGQARRNACDDLLAQLQFVRSPYVEDELFICKKGLVTRSNNPVV